MNISPRPVVPGLLLAAVALVCLSFPALADGKAPPASLCDQNVTIGADGDFLHRPDTAEGVTRWSTGVGNTWTVECVKQYTHSSGQKLIERFRLRSWKGDYLVVDGGKWKGDFNQDRGQTVTSGPITAASTWGAQRHAGTPDTYSIRSFDKAWFLNRGPERQVKAGRKNEGWRIVKKNPWVIGGRVNIRNRWRCPDEGRCGQHISFTGEDVKLYPVSAVGGRVPWKLVPVPGKASHYYIINEWRCPEEKRCGMHLSFTGDKAKLYPRNNTDDKVPWKFVRVPGTPDQYYIYNRWRCGNDGRCGMHLSFTGQQLKLYPADNTTDLTPWQITPAP